VSERQLHLPQCFLRKASILGEGLSYPTDAAVCLSAARQCCSQRGAALFQNEANDAVQSDSTVLSDGRICWW